MIQKKIKLTYSFLIVLLMITGGKFAVSHANSTSQSKAIITNTFGGEESDSAYSVIATSDGGYALIGVTFSYGRALADGWLVKTDADCQLEYSRTLGGDEGGIANSGIVTSDGGFAIVGFTYSYETTDYDMWLVKTNANGYTTWDRTNGGTDFDEARSVIATSDGGYVIAGDTESYGASGKDMYLVKTDANGEMQWYNTYGGNYDDAAYTILATSDGGYALVGYTSSFGAGSKDLWLVKIDDNGQVTWNQTYGGWRTDRSYSAVTTSDGGYALAGYTESYGSGRGDMWLVKTDATGLEIWNKTYGGEKYDTAYSIVVTSDGGYALAGRTDSYGTGQDMWLVRIDVSGAIEWTQTFGGGGGDCAYSVTPTLDGGYALTGSTLSYDVGKGDIWLVKTTLQDNTNYQIPKTANLEIAIVMGSFLVISSYYGRKKRI